MKKVIYGIISALGLFGVASCSDDNSVIYSGDLVSVTFTIAEEGATSTRATYDNGNVYYPTEDGEFPQISDGSKAKRLVWAVYDKDGNLLPELGEKYKSTDGIDRSYGQVVEDVKCFPHTITINLVRGQEYSFAFWAQDENCTAFDTKDLRSVKVDYKSANNNLANDEFRDAFCKVESFTVTSAPSMTRTVILRRPFAQVNVGIPASEYKALRKSGIRIMKSKIHIENVATEFDVVANSTHGDDKSKRQAIDFGYNWIPAYYNYMDEKGELTVIPTDEELAAGRAGENANCQKTQDLKIDLNHDGKITPYGMKNGDGVDACDETYNYMLMAYILPADRNDGTSTYSTTLDRVEFSLLPEKEGQQELTFSLENVPVQRNWRTNIFGEMFTSNVALRIDLDPFYAGDYNYPDWVRVYEGVFFEMLAQTPGAASNAFTRAPEDAELKPVIHISNGAGLVWLANATNGVWKSKADYEADNTHMASGAQLKNDADLMLQACGLKEWPTEGLFRFKDVDIKLEADIDLKAYAKIFGTDGYFTPIAFSDGSCINSNLGGAGYDYTTNGKLNCLFNGNFDGQNHTIYNLKTVRPSEGDNHAYGLFGTVGRTGSIRNLRLKDVDIEGHWHTGGLVGYIFGLVPNWDGDAERGFLIDNCYVDGGTVVSTTRHISGDSYDDGNNVGGIAGIMYNRGVIQNCNVRNLTLRAYRIVAGILGNSSGDYPGGSLVADNKLYECTIIADQFQECDYAFTGSVPLLGEIKAEYDYEINNEFVAYKTAYGGSENLEQGNSGSGNVIYVFSHKKSTTLEALNILNMARRYVEQRGYNWDDVKNMGVSGSCITTIEPNSLLSNPPLDYFPRMARYTQQVNIRTSLLGGPSAYKKYVGDDSKLKGTPVLSSGRVGLWIGPFSNGNAITFNGETGASLLDPATITASDVDGTNDCVVYIKDCATIRNITFHGAKYAGQAICMEPSSGKTISLNNVLAYDAKQVLTDEGNGNDGTLTATNCNFRGFVKLSAGYKAVTFTNTTFDGSTKRADNTTINKLESGTKVTLSGCTFIAPFVVDVPEGSTFTNCKGLIIENGVTVEVPVDGNCTLENK